jgi:hypothetical protein
MSSPGNAHRLSINLRAAFGDAIPAFLKFLLMSGDTRTRALREAQESGHHLLHKKRHTVPGLAHRAADSADEARMLKLAQIGSI